MTSKVLRDRLRCLGWKTCDDGRRLESGRWSLFAKSCGHTLVAIADTRKEAWSAACAMALNLTRNGFRA